MTPLIAAVAYFLFLDKNGNKKSRKNEASTTEGYTPGPPFFQPCVRES